MRDSFEVTGGWAKDVPTWEDALRHLRERIESAGVLVVFNGVVGNNTHRKLDADEFRGFALVDEYAPLVFVNNADFKSAQIFTLIHECAHLWIGSSGVSNFEKLTPSDHAVELWCNAVAAEFLVPKQELRSVWQHLPLDDRIGSVARNFKVSRLVVARRALDLDLINWDTFISLYEESRTKSAGGEGGNFWNSQNVRIGRRFGSAVIRAVKEGRLLYRDAYHLTGLNGDTFDRYVAEMGY
jgi:Zn-dependent peptidase ImmA (M78 family)